MLSPANVRTVGLGWLWVGGSWGVFICCVVLCVLGGTGSQPYQEREGMAESKKRWDQEMRQAEKKRRATEDLLFTLFLFLSCRLLFLFLLSWLFVSVAGCSQKPRTKASEGHQDHRHHPGKHLDRNLDLDNDH